MYLPAKHSQGKGETLNPALCILPGTRPLLHSAQQTDGHRAAIPCRSSPQTWVQGL